MSRAPGAPARGGYVELHCHSAFSLLDGAALPEALVARAAALGYPALALTDHDELGGVVRFAQAADELGVGGIIGAEVTVRDDDGTSHLVLLAEDAEGYANLSTLVTRARMGTPRGEPGVPFSLVADHARGLFALTGCPSGRLPTLLARGDDAGARDWTARLMEAFDRRVAIECWDHQLDQERELVARLIPLAAELDVPWVVTNDVHYLRARDRMVHDALAALRHERTLAEMGTRLRPNGEWHLASPARMHRRWRHAPEGLRATRDIAERCGFRMRELRPRLPDFPLPPGVGADEYLEALVWQGAFERYGVTRGATRTTNDDARVHRQLTHELGMIRRLGLAGYFLIVWDIVRFARREAILCQGRGSAANSAVCYCLGITAVDPIRLNLLFERFLSEERKEAPDIDIDFAHRERERVIQYVYRRYGREHAAMVCEQITWRGRSAVRDAARVLGYPLEEAERLALLADRFSAKGTAERIRATVAGPVSENTTLIGGPDPRDGELRGRGVDGMAGAGETVDPVTPSSPDAPPVILSEAKDPHVSPTNGRFPAGAGARAQLAQALGERMITGTEATTKSRAVKEAAMRVTSVGSVDKFAAAREGRALTSSDRPFPSTGFEPYGSPSAQDSVRTTGTRAAAIAKLSHGAPASSAASHQALLLADLVEGLHQLPRHRSIHVGGFVLTGEPLAQVVPIEPASMPERTVIQWEKDDLDPVGLVKIDLLGLGMLTLLQDCLAYIRTTRGETLDLGALDMDDQAVFDGLCRADTIGIFQVESRAQMNTLPRLKPRCFYDLVVQVAIIRPGPIQGDMVHPYLRRRAGTEAVTYPHPSLEPILERTLGVPLFQEQGMQVAIACADFTPGEADQLRRAMGHKRSRERMAAICQKLIDGMKRNGIDEATALRIYNQINAFADYGFPESHAASFALLVYASAYLKHYYAPEFTAAILNAQPMGFYSVGTIIEDARRHGVTVHPINAAVSQWDTTLERENGRNGPPAVRLGLRLVRGLGPKAKERITSALEDGPFSGIRGFVQRTALDRRALHHLAEAGAFDAYVAHEPDPRRRRAALWEVLEAARGEQLPLAPMEATPLPASVPAMSPSQLTAADYRMTGLSLAGHPMLHLREILAPNGVRAARDLHDGCASGALRDGIRVAVAGLVICRQRPGTAKGFVFLTLEDETGTVNVVVTPTRFEREALLISTSPLLLVRGVLQVEGRVVNIRADQFRALDAEVGAEHARRHDFH